MGDCWSRWKQDLIAKELSQLPTDCSISFYIFLDGNIFNKHAKFRIFSFPLIIILPSFGESISEVDQEKKQSHKTAQSDNMLLFSQLAVKCSK